MKKSLKSQLIGMPYQNELPKRLSKPDWNMKVEVIKSNGTEYLRTILYKKIEAKYIIFCDRETHDFSTYKIEDEKWSEAMIINLDWSLYYISRCSYVDKKSETIATQFLGIKAETSGEAIREFQMRKKTWEYKKRFENSERRTKELMDQVGKLPNDIYDFIDKHVLRSSRYLYYKPIEKNKIECFCSHCRETLTIERPKKLKGQLINQQMTCPHCHSKATLKSQKRAPWMRDKDWFNIIEKISEGFIIRSFEVARSYSNNFENEPKTVIVGEVLRNHLYTNGMRTYIEKETYSHTLGWLPKRWVKQEYNSNYNGFVYFKNLDKVLKNTEYQYCALKEYAKKCRYISVSDYFETYSKFPNIEKLVKLGFISLTKDIIANGYSCSSIEFDKKDIYKMLGISRSDLQELRKIDPDYCELEMWKTLRKSGKKAEIELIKKIRNMGGIRWFTNSSLKNVCQYTNIRRFIKYAEQQQAKMSTDFIDILGEWNDYIGNAKLLKYDLHDTMYLFPYDLKKAHDNAMEKVKLEKDKLTSEAITRIYKECISKFEFRDKDFIVTLPKNYVELEREGKKLCHCVATYAGRIAKEECIIIFIRKASEPNKPFYTAEIRNGQLCQLKGLRNCSATPEVDRFFEKYQKIVLNKKGERKAV